MIQGVDELRRWLARVSGREWCWSTKYISANDTYAKANVHQAGPYIGKELLRAAFPALATRAATEPNPDLVVPVEVVSHGDPSRPIRLVWYNSAVLQQRSTGRNEARMTGWGGRKHPLVSEDATGSLAVFAFHQAVASADADACEIWITTGIEEEEEVLSVVGSVEPGQSLLFRPTGSSFPWQSSANPCALRAEEIRSEWAREMPSGEDIIEMVLHRMKRAKLPAVDQRLLDRRGCEYQLFRSLEEHLVGPRVRRGFGSVEEFIAFAHSVTNRRKARAGRSLELHTRAILGEEKVSHSWTERTEDKRTPDFVFPSIAHYRNPGWPAKKLLMLAAKTTCKDRWRQILNEAQRIPQKHLLTLQEGVSEPQYREMKDEGVTLVVPRKLHAKYPDSVRAELMSFSEFLDSARALGS